jgi:hypothetical protein
LVRGNAVLYLFHSLSAINESPPLSPNHKELKGQFSAANNRYNGPLIITPFPDEEKIYTTRSTVTDHHFYTAGGALFQRTAGMSLDEKQTVPRFKISLTSQ